MILSGSKLSLLLPLSLLLAAAVTHAAISHKRPFRSVKSPSETVEKYEIVNPVVKFGKNARNDNHYPSRLTVTIETEDGTTYILSLFKNRKLMSDKFKCIVSDLAGKEVVDHHHYDNCYYKGRVIGHPTWMAAVSACHGLQGEFGTFGDPENLYHLEPKDAANPSLTAEHHFYKDTENNQTEKTCGMGPGQHGHKIAMNVTHKSKVRRQVAGERIMEWTIVNDAAQYNAFGNNLQATVERALAIANGVDLIYHSIGIGIAVVNVITFTNGNLFPEASASFALLDSFTRNYVQSVLIPEGVHFDSAMLLTGIEIDGTTVGTAYIGTMCNRNFATGFTQDGGRSTGSVISTVAHELGHIFNMEHDDGRSCNCAAGTSRCVMQGFIGFPPPTVFSSCSVSDLNVLYSEGGDSCLLNAPTEVVGDPVCGNGILEDGEVCDCGSPDECTNNCCDAATCQLAAGAQCASGACCTDQCMLASYGTQCRASEGDCDIAEFCLGDSNECPADVFKANGVSCRSNTGYCLNGECPTHEDQCNDIFTNTAAGFAACFSLNTRGDLFGFCRQTATDTYSACASSDVQCGKLHCRGGDYRNNQGVSVSTATFTLSQGTCRSISLNGAPSSPEDLNVGTVLEGTKCGDGRMCASRRCVPLSTSSCPRGANNQECSGTINGVCNSDRKCSCNVGFTGSACESSIAPDVDECEDNNGGCAETCINLVGSFRCSCSAGYTLASDNVNCEDVNECSVDNGGCDGTCTNTVGSFQCSCGSGFTLDTDERTCNDIDECQTNNGGCEQRCNNQEGSFRCSCNSGFSLNSDGRTCSALSGPCTSAGLVPGCCQSSCRVGNCYCDEACRRFNDCCSDVLPLSQTTCE